MKNKIEDLVIDFLKRQELKYVKLEDGAIRVNFKIENNPRIYNFLVIQEDGWCIFSTTDNLRKEWNLDNKDLVALAIAKINFFIRRGSFQFDDVDGEIRFKSFTAITPEMQSAKIIDVLLYKDLKNALTMLPRLEATILEATKGEYIAEITMIRELKMENEEA